MALLVISFVVSSLQECDVMDRPDDPASMLLYRYLIKRADWTKFRADRDSVIIKMKLHRQSVKKCSVHIQYQGRSAGNSIFGHQNLEQEGSDSMCIRHKQ